MSKLNAISYRVKEQRKKMGLSQEQLAQKCECSRVYLSQVENGKTTLSVNIAQRLADIFDCDLDYLLDDEWVIPNHKKILNDIADNPFLKSAEGKAIVEIFCNLAFLNGYSVKVLDSKEKKSFTEFLQLSKDKSIKKYSLAEISAISLSMADIFDNALTLFQKGKKDIRV